MAVTGSWAAPLVLRAVASAGGVPLTGRGTGQELARHELARSIYQPSLVQRIMNWISDFMSSAAQAVPGGPVMLALLAAGVIALVVVVVVIARPSRSRGHRLPAPIADKPRTAREHRQDAERHAAAGDFSLAIIERVRAVAAELEEREVVGPRPGRTADELAAEAGRRLPAQAASLRSVARMFDEVRYGDRPGTADGYAAVCRIDSQISSARPVPTGTGPQFSATGARP